ncbi:MAG: T9SS type A sorting domain-containing protein, partial [Bacteroidota bacterium]
DNSLLPAQISNFTGQQSQDRRVRLQWTATSIAANEGFEVERSIDGNIFTGLTLVPGEQTYSPGAYEYIDKTPVDGMNYYRLRHIYPDGHSDYSNIISVKSAASGFFIQTNPVKDVLKVIVKNPATFILSDISGRRLKSIYFQTGTNSVYLPQLPGGIYFLQSLKNGQIQKFYVSD